MDDKIVRIKEFGCNTDEALGRVFGNYDIFFKCLGIVVNDENLTNLVSALKNNNIDLAFKCAHSLKGAYANLALTPLLLIDEEIVEALRKKSTIGVLDKALRLVELNNNLKGLLD